MTSGPVACETCGEQVKEPRYLQRHLDEVHCPTAHVRLPDGRDFTVYRGADGRFQCPLCVASSLKTSQTLIGHIEKSCPCNPLRQRPLQPERSPVGNDDGGLYRPGGRTSQSNSQRKKRGRPRRSDPYSSHNSYQFRNETDSAAATNGQVQQPSYATPSHPAAVNMNQGSNSFASGPRHVEPQAAPVPAVDPALHAFLAGLPSPLDHHLDAFKQCGIDSMMKLDMLPAMPKERKNIDDDLKKRGVTVFDLSMLHSTLEERSGSRN